MASRYSAYASDGSRLRVDDTWTQDYAANQTTITLKGYIENAKPIGGTLSASLTIDGTTITRSVGSPISTQTVYVGSYTKTITHNPDGKKSIYVQGRYTSKYEDGSSTGVNLYINNSLIVFTDIPRYPNFVQQYVYGHGLQNIWVRWQPDTPCGAQYSLNEGPWTDLPSWTEWGSDFEITGLYPNSYYNVRVKITRQDNWLETVSNWLEFTTKDIARVQSANNINDEQNPYMTFTNPSGSTIRAKLEWVDANNTGSLIALRENISSTGNYTFVLTETEKNIIYQKSSKSNTLKIRYVIVITSGATELFSHWIDKTITIVNANPIFNNFIYADINAATLALTNDSQKIIKGYSNIRATISVANKAISQKNATMSKYSFITGSKAGIDGIYSDIEDVDMTVNSADGNVASIYAIDSRNNSTKKDIPVQLIEYVPINIQNLSAMRGTGGIGTQVTLNFDGFIWNNNFGIVQNEIISATYRFKKTTDSEWINGTTNIMPVLNENSYSKSVNIIGDLGANGFDSAFSYNLEITIKDKLSTSILKAVLQSGKPQLAFGIGEGSSFGAFYDYDVGGPLQVNGLAVCGYEVVEEWN